MLLQGFFVQDICLEKPGHYMFLRFLLCHHIIFLKASF